MSKTIEDLASEAASARTELHSGHGSQRPLSEGYDHVGMAGELAFGKAVGLMPDFSLKSRGDKGVDFLLPLLLTVDVKTFRNPYNLPHEVGKNFADLFVLAGYKDEEGEANLIGWATGWELKNAPTKKLPKQDVLNHCIPAENLRPMDHLFRKLMLGRKLVLEGEL